VLKCTKIDFRWDSASDPVGRAYSALQVLYLDLRGLLLRGEKGEGKEGKERGGEGPPPCVGMGPQNG